LIADSIAVLVISWKTILGASLGNFNIFDICHAIASHSRSSSVANQTLSNDFIIFLNSFTTFFLSGDTSYVGSNQFSISTHNFFFERSTTCHIDAFTSKSFHKNFFIVLALAGDSTITKFFTIF
jgi:hypothetical protein